MKQSISYYAEALYGAVQARRAIPPLTEQEPDITVEEAYAIQMQTVTRAQKEGLRISGKKIGITSAGMQEMLGVYEPDYGHLFSSMHCKDGNIPTDQLLLPKIESEIAFVLKKDLSGGQVTVEDVQAATDYVLGAFEIVDSRIRNWEIKLADTVADNASSARYVLGNRPVHIESIDLLHEHMALYQNGEQVSEGTGAAVMGDPCLAVAWLANKLWSFGVPLKSGEVILSGAFAAAPAARKGDVFRVEFSTLGRIEAAFI